MDDHDHNHDHDHQPPPDDASEHTYHGRRSAAIQALLVEKGLIAADDIRRQVEVIDSRTPALGATVVARAWTDPQFKARLLANAKDAVAEIFDYQADAPALVSVENTDAVHNVIVCTLCSCYPTGLLGLSPAWYKSLAYRSRTVKDPRDVLTEFGLELAPEIGVRVYDSTADMRYMVVPQRPPETEHMDEEALAELVTRDSMIGVARARMPGEG